MQYFVLFSTTFALITFLHYSSLKLQDKYQIYTRIFNKNAFNAHLTFTGILWTIWFILLLRFPVIKPEMGLPFYTSQFMPVGVIVFGGGLLLTVWSWYLLGVSRAWGLRYFESDKKKNVEKRGPYKHLKNPIYDGFVLLFFGIALIFNSLIHLLIGLECFILFNILLSAYENKKLIN